MEGWISLHRKLMSHWIWKNDKYFKAWIYCLFRANHESNKVLIGSDLVKINRGQFVTSIGNFANDTGMTVQSVRTFWKLLEVDSMINKRATSKLTKITICNYDSYQGSQQTNNTESTNKQQTSNKPTTTDNNVNNENNDKKVYREFVHLSITINQCKKLTALGYNKRQIDNILDQIENFQGNKKYKSLYLTSKAWLKKEEKKTTDGRDPKSENAPEGYGERSPTAIQRNQYKPEDK